MYKRKNKYYKVIDATTNCKQFLVKEYKKLFWFYIPRHNRQAFWIDDFEFKKYMRIK